MPRRNVIGVAPTIHPVHSRQVANRIGAFLLFFFSFYASLEIDVEGWSTMRYIQQAVNAVRGSACNEGTQGRG
jgi:hypothetical protein